MFEILRGFTLSSQTWHLQPHGAVCVFPALNGFVCLLCTGALLSAMLWIWNRTASICTAAIPPRYPHTGAPARHSWPAGWNAELEVFLWPCVEEEEAGLCLLLPLFVWVHFLVCSAFGFLETVFVFTCRASCLSSHLPACFVATSWSPSAHLYLRNSHHKFTTAKWCLLESSV